MRKSRLSAAVIAVVLATACGGTATPAGSGASRPAEAAAGSEAPATPQDSAGSGEELFIGFVGGLTGALAPYDQPNADGLTLWAEEINAEGGIDGSFPVRLEIRDSRTEPEQAVVLAQELLAAGINVLATPCDVGPSVAAGQLAQEQQIPAFAPCSSTPTLAPSVGDFFFQVSAADNLQAAALADHAVEQGYQTAYVLKSPDTGYTQKLPEYFAEAFEERGGEVLTQANYTMGQQNFGAAVEEIESQEPDVVMTSAYEPDFPAFMRQLRSAGIDTPVLGSDGIDTPTTFELGNIVEGVVFATHGFPSEGSELVTFNQKFEEHYGRPSETIFNALGYDFGLILEEAVTQAGTTDPIAIRDAVAQIEDLQVATGTVTYAGTNGVPLRDVSLVRIGEGGERSLVDRLVPEQVPAP